MIVDLFAGPGGWDLGARWLGMDDVVGFEHSHDENRTAIAAGFSRVECDVAAFPLAQFPEVEGLIASPPCPTFSTAGKGEGRYEIPLLLAHARKCRDGWAPCSETFSDPRTPLSLEPLRWVDALKPEWIALENVPPVLDLWEAFAATFREWGYETWTGVLNAADYGVPQTRRRAFLIASRSRVSAPEASHARNPGMFGELPWVSMADALGWGIADQPCMTITGGGTESGGAEPVTHPKPSPTITSLAGGQWIFNLPATTVAADPRISARCHHDEGSQGRDAKTVEQVLAGDYAPTEAIKLTIAQALILQSFPADYPVQGTRTARFRQVGNAVPPLLAAHVLAEASGCSLSLEGAA